MSRRMTQPLPKDFRAENGDRRHAGAHIERPDELGREQYSISDLTSEFGCTARALRFYEDEGLIAADDDLLIILISDVNHSHDVLLRLC